MMKRCAFGLLVLSFFCVLGGECEGGGGRLSVALQKDAAGAG
jgi:hypothetical protein